MQRVINKFTYWSYKKAKKKWKIKNQVHRIKDWKSEDGKPGLGTTSSLSTHGWYCDIDAIEL